MILNTTLHSDDHNRVLGPCRNQLNRFKCVFCNIIGAFWICLDGGYTWLCVCYHVGGDELEYMIFSKAVPDNVARYYCEGLPYLNQDRVHVVRLKPCGTILQHPLSLQNIVESLQFWVRPVVVGLVADGVTWFKYEVLDILSLHLC